ncbi:uncharacterized protein L969DRAFT_125103 [Mixia osmundae IAM 14324]|uniref:Anaphase-promoting complex subunit 2 n=1 Tax=Mixia osmundae (strain CBS 9802 / IAM 14324 / JCM 22182 / KY 12970) TaxID=764103 RepID=G7DVC9_MIXOS|nr:uncharacterized protein L969DRAFT_125103 [Mixia osmundae IAM 14324]KEI42040.1 hypothetical protein L969DRAFT_125103 [Mixia osmundae IAM 14324]GAA94539.1 hypothetical protein E5Q_01191 [Mixia osmundae IAM 14324]
MQAEQALQQALQQLCRGDASQASLAATAAAWSTVQEACQPVDRRTTAPLTQLDADLLQAFQIVAEAQLEQDLLADYLDNVSDRFEWIEQDIAAFEQAWSQEATASQMHAFFGMLLEWKDAWQAPLLALGGAQGVLMAYMTRFTDTLLPCLPARLPDAVQLLFSDLLSDSSSSESLQSLTAMRQLGLLARYEPVVYTVAYSRIEETVRSTCASVFDTPGLLQQLRDWIVHTLAPWLGLVYGSADVDARKLFAPALLRFDHHVHKTLYQLRRSEMFDIIVDFPESQACLADLRECIGKAGDRSGLADDLRAQTERRLLHPGADTRDIITQYISTIRCLRILDPTGVLLLRVADPIRSYLRARPDAIRSVVSLLIEEDGSMAEELGAGGDVLVDVRAETVRREVEDYSDPNWMPDPVDAPPQFRERAKGDAVQMLVSIYQSKDLIIKELQAMLATRLLQLEHYDFDRERRQIEILKLRFGEASLQICDNMLQDISDSKRVDGLIHSAGNEAQETHAIIASRTAWPAFNDLPIKPARQLLRAQTAYEKAYRVTKPDKRLKFKHSLGYVVLDLEFEDRQFTCEATPIQASVLYTIQSAKRPLTVANLAHALATREEALVRSALAFWAQKRVLKPVGDEWQIMESLEGEEDTQIAAVPIDEIQPESVATADEELETMRVHWAFIKGLLANMGASTTEQIHMMLERLIPTYSGSRVDRMAGFLSMLQREGLIDADKDKWRLI